MNGSRSIHMILVTVTTAVTAVTDSVMPPSFSEQS